MNIDFKGRIVLVTGAGKGIGRCIALKVSKLGAKVYAISRTESDLDSLKEEDSSIETRCLDIGNCKNTRKVIGDIGQENLLVNNAGISKRKTILEATEEFIDEHFDVNFKAALNISQIVVKGIISRKGSGAIVNISSISSTLAFTGYPIYCTTKAAMDMLTKSMALEFGLFKSCDKYFMDVQDQNKLTIYSIEKDEVANTVAFLLSDYASIINGALVPVDGGHSIHMSPNPVQ
ncbi:L-xylulose reductase-like [Mytilus edulis]|uniref:L-xylulose reductase-like n=1 Tax=Mytilus edulis TaxID=6550 RepID=UPI0039F09938